jgi:glycine/D-amino acid oxidase-like deaminating enzyme/nitrite reductase/ring-hydroxylating ferredoxin subunit
MAQLEQKWGRDVLRQTTALREDALRSIEQWIAQFNIECALQSCNLHYYLESPSAQDMVAWERERAAYEAAGLVIEDRDGEVGFATQRCFTLPGQAQFNPYLFVHALAQLLAECGVLVFEQSPVLEVEAKEGIVRTAQATLRADHIVMATHTPLGFNLLQAEMEVYREYGVALRTAQPSIPDGVHWIKDKTRSLRPYAVQEEHFLVVVGEKHKTGEHESGVDYAQRLFDYAQERYETQDEHGRWSAQQFKSADGLPYIGPSAHDNVWVATGFGADGLVWGTVAAQIICEGINNTKSDAAELLTPRRFTPVKSAKVWAKENAAVVKHLVGDRLRPSLGTALEDIAPGQGQIIRLEGKTVAAYRDRDGAVCTLSPVCPHLGCHVAWNDQESSWDCPCHGSRFTPIGEVIEGPALRALAAMPAEDGHEPR